MTSARTMPRSTAMDEGRVVCYFDGACPSNQFRQKGPMRAAYVIGEEAFLRGVADCPTKDGAKRSNNIAEYQGLILLLQDLRGRERGAPGKHAYLICGDSQLILRQMTGEYRVKEPHLAVLREEARALAQELDVRFRWVPRGSNRAGELLETERFPPTR